MSQHFNDRDLLDFALKVDDLLKLLARAHPRARRFSNTDEPPDELLDELADAEWEIRLVVDGIKRELQPNPPPRPARAA